VFLSHFDFLNNATVVAMCSSSKAIMEVLDHPETYFLLSFILLLIIFSWNYLQQTDESLRLILFLASCNFFLSVLYITFSGTCFWFFGRKSTKQYQNKVFEMIISFLMSKIVILELASQESVMDGWHWTFWLVLLSWAKGLTYHANFYVYYISQCGESNWLQYFFPFFHVIPVFFLCRVAVVMIGLWTERAPTKKLMILLWYDILILFVETGQVVCKFAFELTDSLFPSLSSNLTGSISLLELLSEFILTTLSLLHLLHIIFINGISVTLVGAATIVNLSSVSTKLLNLLVKLREFFLIKSKVKNLFPNLLLKDASTSDPICPICLQGYQSNVCMKLLPCSHGIHENCLRTLLQNHTIYLREDSQFAEGSQSMELALANLRIFRCPICRQCINAETADLLEIKSSKQPPPPPEESQEGEQTSESNKSPEISSQTFSDEQIREGNPHVLSRMSLLWNVLENTLLNFGGASLQVQNREISEGYRGNDRLHKEVILISPSLLFFPPISLMFRISTLLLKCFLNSPAI
jgi:hypothetical protein